MDNSSIQINEYSIQVDNLFVKLFNTFITKKEPSMVIPASMHSHPYAEFFACSNGCIHIKSENNTYTLHSGDIAIVPSSLMHQMSPDLETDSKWACIGIICSECISKNGRNLYHKISGLINSKDILIFNHNNDFFSIIEKIISSTPSMCEPWLLMEFVSALSKLTTILSKPKFPLNKCTDSMLENMDRLLALDHYINCFFMNELSNKDIANELYISERQLSRLVLAQYGTTLHTQICRKRISVAAKLLIESSDSVESIALSVGFKSKMGFYREFKKTYGMTPAQFRIYNQSATY